jgi:NAD(P)H-dependent flavin oxidoreductase YrpB (nitropropane dioxygenase family)
MPSSISTELGLSLPVVAAPMAGGPTTTALVTAAGKVGALAFLAAGYKTPDAVADEITAVRSTGIPFGVNLFAPNSDPVGLAEFRRYAAAMQAEADRYGVELLGETPREDDDYWAEKVSLLVQHPVPVVSLTFGLPDAEVIARLRRAGSLLVQTVTSVPEAAAAAEAGVDALAVQGISAGGHSGTFTPHIRPPDLPLTALVADVRGATGLPVIAAGGVGTAEDVTALLASGAEAVAVGTALLRTHEAGTNPTHRAALVDLADRGTVLTHAFTGRPARGLRNEFIERYEATAPYGYPALNHLTSPLRRAAAAAGDPERLHVWAGTGYRAAVDEPVAVTLARLSRGL